MKYLLFLSLVLPLGTVHPSGPELPTELVLGMKAREAALLALDVYGWSDTFDGEGALRFSGALRMRKWSGLERWTRYSVSAPDPTEAATATSLLPHERFDLLLEQSPPRFAILDHSRTLVLEWDAHGDDLGSRWLGLLTTEIDRSERQGQLHVGWMFGERFLTECLDRFALHDREELDGGVTRFTFTYPDVEPSAESFVVDLSDSGIATRFAWAKRGKEQYVATVTSTVEIDGIELPSAGSIRYSYGSAGRLEVTLSYRKRSTTVEPESLFDLPEEVDRTGARVIVQDMLSNSQFDLRDGSGGWSLSSLETAGAGSSGDASADKAGSSLITLVVIGGVLFAILFASWFRRQGRQSNEIAGGEN
jgi:hypothetical protein